MAKTARLLPLPRQSIFRGHPKTPFRATKRLTSATSKHQLKSNIQYHFKIRQVTLKGYSLTKLRQMLLSYAPVRMENLRSTALILVRQTTSDAGTARLNVSILTGR